MTFHRTDDQLRDTLHAAARGTQADGELIDRLLINAQAGRNLITPLRRRRVWLAPLLAAAAVLIVAVGYAAALASLRHHPAPGTHPNAPAATTPPRTHTSTHPSTHTAPTPSSQPPRPSSPTPGAPTTVKEFQGVQVTVPRTWTMFSQPVHSASGVCFTPTRSRAGCVLTLSVPIRVNEGHVFRPNAISGQDEPGTGCLAGGAHPVTVAADRLSIDGKTALYKRYRMPCGQPPFEQWVVPTRPGIIFLHTLTGTSMDRYVESIVNHAVLPGPHVAPWLGDNGIITAVSPDGSHDQVTMHRIVPLEQGNYLLEDTATDLVPTDLTISLTQADGHTSELSLTELQRWARGRAPANAGPLDTYAAEISRRYGSRRYSGAVSLHLSPLPGHPVTLPSR